MEAMGMDWVPRQEWEMGLSPAYAGFVERPRTGSVATPIEQETLRVHGCARWDT